jgi:hypothetical protein
MTVQNNNLPVAAEETFYQFQSKLRFGSYTLTSQLLIKTVMEKIYFHCKNDMKYENNIRVDSIDADAPYDNYDSHFPDMKSDFSISNMIFAMKINIVIEAKTTTGYATHYKLKLKQCAKYSYHIT